MPGPGYLFDDSLPGFKNCTSCGELKLVSEFYKRSGTEDGLRAHCIACLRSNPGGRAAVDRYQKKNKQKLDEARNRYRESRKEYYKAKCSKRHREKREQKWATAPRPRPESCEICGVKGEPFPSKKCLVFDHCHKTGVFRGWLCQNCNRALGLMKDNPALIRKLAEYLDAIHTKTSETVSEQVLTTDIRTAN